MTTPIRFLRAAASVIAIVFLHTMTPYILPFPWVNVNTTFLLLIIILLMTENGSIVWISFIAHLFLELFATTPFGIILFAGTLTTLAAFWLYQYFFTNQSWYTAIALCFFSVISYRTIYTALLLTASALLGRQTPPWKFLGMVYSWEIVLTSIMCGALYIVIARPFRFRKQALPQQWV